MKLASMKGGRDGILAVVSNDLKSAVFVPQIAATMQSAVDNWASVEPRLKEVSQALNNGGVPGAFAFDETKAHCPLPRAYQWCEGSVYLVHLERTRKSTSARKRR